MGVLRGVAVGLGGDGWGEGRVGGVGVDGVGEEANERGGVGHFAVVQVGARGQGRITRGGAHDCWRALVRGEDADWIEAGWE